MPSKHAHQQNGRRMAGVKHAIDTEAGASLAANEHCLLNYGTSYCAGMPYRLSLPTAEVWIVPAVFTSPGYGVVGESRHGGHRCGDGDVVGATPRR